MRILTEEEYQSAPLVQKGRKAANGSNPVLNAIRRLKVGDHLFFGVEDWPANTPPINLLNQSFRKSRGNIRLSVRTLKAGSGWIVTRLDDRT